ncbi:MAG: FAD-binding protein [Nocardiaceae bacterium]|nr:FAD-binding protein [Nocardiaceae bacterium]
MFGSDISRRGFLRGSAVLGAGLALPSLSACSEAPAAAAMSSLHTLLPGRVVRPGDPDYTSFVTPWNLAWQKARPKAAAIVRASSTDDVAAALRWAHETGTAIVARSGGHSYAGYSTTPGVVIDVSRMTSVGFNPSTNVATLGGGVRNIHAGAEFQKIGRTITHGRCYQVGYAGLVLGGGIGFNVRRLGMTCDQLIETTVVLASGEVVRAAPDENSDLLWAAKGGGGGNFGIHTSFVVQTYDAPPVTVFDILWRENVEQVLRWLLDFVRYAPREFGAKITVRATPQPSGPPRVTVGLLGQLVGTLDETTALLDPAFAIAEPDRSYGFLREASYWDGQKRLSDEGTPERSAERSVFINNSLGDDGVALILDHMRKWPPHKGLAQWKAFATGGAANDVAPTATAFVHRQSWMLAAIDVAWEGDDPESDISTSLGWLDEFHAALAPYGSGAYQNFLDPRERDWAQAYYGENFGRLVNVKRKYDPRNVFHNGQSIPLDVMAFVNSR